MRLFPVPGVFQPLGDSHMLADHLRRERLGPGVSVLDLCAGSGLLALVAATDGATATAVDLSRRAVVSVRLNAALNGVKVTALRGDLFGPVRGQRFDVIVSNPPYLPAPGGDRSTSGVARAWDAGPTGRVLLDRITNQVADYLTPRGALLLIHSSVCGERETIDTLNSRGLRTRVVFRHRGPLGPRLASRADFLREHGLLLPNDEEELIIVRATKSPGVR